MYINRILLVGEMNRIVFELNGNLKYQNKDFKFKDTLSLSK